METIRQLVQENKTYKQIKEILTDSCGSFSPKVRRWFSEQNIRLFCSKHGLTRLSEAQVDVFLANAPVR